MLILTDEQKVALAIEPQTAAGNPAKVDGKPVWSVSDSNVITLTVAEDGLSAEAVSTGVLGTAQVTVVADADLGEGIRELNAVLDIEVKAAEAVSLGIKAGTPVTK